MRTVKVLLLLPAFFFFACNNASEIKSKNADTAIVENHAEHETQEPAKELSLNNGAKWQTDENTRTHVTKLQAQIDDFNKKGIEDTSSYRTLALELQKELNDLVNDCKMKGPDHDALHVWLVPVLGDVSDLKKIRTTSEGRQIAGQLSRDINKFNQYFN